MTLDEELDQLLNEEVSDYELVECKGDVKEPAHETEESTGQEESAPQGADDESANNSVSRELRQLELGSTSKFAENIGSIPSKRPKAPNPKYANRAEVVEPDSIKHALRNPVWLQAMQQEYDALVAMETWELTELPKGRKCVGSTWAFKVKKNSDGIVERCKARLCAQGCSQTPGIDYGETYSPVAKQPSIRVMLSLANHYGWYVHQLDVTCAFLNGKLDPTEEVVYMRQPAGFDTGCGRVLKLNRALYGLKQSARLWFETFDMFLLEEGFDPLHSDRCIYRSQTATLFVVVYVDDILVMSDEMSRVEKMKKHLCAKWKCVDQGAVHHILGMKITRDEVSLKIDLEQYCLEAAERFGLHHSKPKNTPMQVSPSFDKDGEAAESTQLYQAMVGTLNYAATICRPDLSYTVGHLAQWNCAPTQVKFGDAKRALRYLNHTADQGIMFQRRKKLELCGYADASWAEDQNDRKSTGGFVLMLGGGPVSWRSKKQGCVSRSSTEAEYVALSDAIQEAKWLISMLKELRCIPDPVTPMTMYEDNQGCIAISDPMSKDHGRTKHIDIHYHFAREAIEDGLVVVKYCPTNEMSADMFTKSLPEPAFEELRGKIGMRSKLEREREQDAQMEPKAKKAKLKSVIIP